MIYLKKWNDNLGYDSVFQEAHKYLIENGAELVDEYDGGLYSEKEYSSANLDIYTVKKYLAKKVSKITLDEPNTDSFDSFGEYMDADERLTIEVNTRGEKKGPTDT